MLYNKKTSIEIDKYLGEDPVNRKDFHIIVSTNGNEDCTVARLEVNTGLRCDLSVLIFTFECEEQYAAQLLVADIEYQITEKLRNIRRESYNKGWKDAKSKKKKLRNFFGSWVRSSIGY